MSESPGGASMTWRSTALRQRLLRKQNRDRDDNCDCSTRHQNPESICSRIVFGHARRLGPNRLTRWRTQNGAPEKGKNRRAEGETSGTRDERASIGNCPSAWPACSPAWREARGCLRGTGGEGRNPEGARCLTGPALICIANTGKTSSRARARAGGLTSRTVSFRSGVPHGG
jgi:hypothetical protein